MSRKKFKSHASADAKAAIKKIKKDWSALRVYAKMRGINVFTLKRALYGYSTSKPMCKILVEDGYLAEDADLKRVVLDDTKE